MSYESENNLPLGTTLKQVREVINLLGFVKVNDGLKVPNRIDCLMWHEPTDYKSWVGVELDIYKKDKMITVTTRSRMGRSYWDLIQQNKTIKTLKDLFGGEFFTDEGKGRYMRPNSSPPSHVSSGCYLARWRFANALIKPKIYIQQRGLDQQNTKVTGLDFLDEMNPLLFSNNLLLPYLVAIWEEFLKSCFGVLLKYTEDRQAVLKRARISHEQLEAIASGEFTVEHSLAGALSFQRPSNVSKNFKLLKPKFDLAGVLRKPYRRRKKSLYESLETVVEVRNEFVHSGKMDIRMTDKEILRLIGDFEVAVDRIYGVIGKEYKFNPKQPY